jgi:hypothetical protein
MPKASPLLDYRLSVSGGFIVTAKIWLVPDPVPGSSHSFNYSLFFGRPGERLVGYDNERGKGDHRHYGGREETYRFVSIERPMADFVADIERVRGSLR